VPEQEWEVVTDPAFPVVPSVWQTPQAWIRTTASPGPGSGTLTVTDSTRAPLLRAITPVTS